ncbi:MAG: DUF349 domain-containing protein [Bacteroidetes bacterium]|nr:DUF349 domain-containing protein [Bacteroidota bacterium]
MDENQLISNPPEDQINQENLIQEEPSELKASVEAIISSDDDPVTDVEISGEVTTSSLPADEPAAAPKAADVLPEKPKRRPGRPKKTAPPAEIIVAADIISEIAPPSEAKDQPSVPSPSPMVEQDAIVHLTPVESGEIKLEIDSDEIEEAEEEIETRVSVENFDDYSKAQLVDLIEETVKESDITKIKTRVALIKVAFLKRNREDKDHKLSEFISAGGVEGDFLPATDPLEERFNAAFEKYRQNKSIFNEELERIKHANFETKKKILEELKELINSEETLKKTYDEFKSLQDQWKQIGLVPKNEVNNLWQSYHFLVEKFFDKVKINKELKDLDLKKNLEYKIRLCEKAEELLLEPSINKSFKELQQLHEDWKEVGPVAQDKKDEIWERFRSVTEKINERRREYYQELQQDLENNYNTKLVLCDKAEQLIAIPNESVSDWQNNTEQINELFRIWRSVGPAPKKYNDKVWERFKSAIDMFFSSKKEYFGKVKEQQINNYNLKLDLCVQAEALKNSTDWRQTTQDFIALQKDWRNIGPVPRKHSNKIWRRFRAACDEFFSKKAEYFSNIQKHEEENLHLKEDLVKRVQEAQFTGDKNEDLRIIKEMQREWMDIGHVPMKDKDRLQNEFRSAINKQLDKLKINAVEISALNYKSRYESLRNAPDSQHMLSKERNILINKITRLKEDIGLWENNIGFLAQSKNAVLLKNEFEKKINSAKQEVIILATKLRILNGQKT